MRFSTVLASLAALGLATSQALAAPPTVGGCQVFPADNYWNTPIDTLPVHAFSNAWVTTIGTAAKLHPDWGNVLSDNFGIPFTTVTSAQPAAAIVPYTDPSIDFSDESDGGPYPIPNNAPIEGGSASTGDRHVLVIETNNCILYELYNATYNGNNTWSASSFAKWPLNSNALRPADWTSADAAGLPIFPGLVRYEEAVTGNIEHAIRFTAVNIWGKDAVANHIKYLWPARHNSGTNTTMTRPPMGARFRLKSSYVIPSVYNPLTKTILRAMQKYGLVLVDGGSNWFFQGVSDTNWPDVVFTELKTVAGSNFEAVDTSLLQINVNSAQSKQNVDGNPNRLFNISTRGQVLTGNDVMIAGFIISGTTPKTVVVNVAGPSLANFGITNGLANPTLTLVRSSDQAVLGTNDDWQSQGAANVTTIQVSGFQPNHAQEPAIVATLAPGAYTAIVSGVGNTTGVGLVGVFEMDRPDAAISNISTRGKVLTGNDVMIAGFIINGTTSKTVVVNVAGPSLVPFGIANALLNPTLTLVRSSDQFVLGTNDNWQTQTNPGDVAAIQATGFQPNNSAEPALIATLPPGAYTAIVSGVGGSTGVGLVGVFAAP
jgi:hypothetical protein